MAANQVDYEYWIHGPNEDELDFVDFPPVSADALDNDPSAVELVKSIGNDDEGVIERQHVTLNPDWSIPSRFDEGGSIPKYVRQGHEKWRKANR